MSYLDDIRPHMAAVPARAKAVLLALWAHADPRERRPVVWPSAATLAATLAMGERTVRRSIAELSAAGALEKMTGSRVRLLRCASAPSGQDWPPGEELPDDRIGQDLARIGQCAKPNVANPVQDPANPVRDLARIGNQTTKNTQEQPALSPIRRPSANRAVATRPVGDDAGDPSWRVVLTEALAMTPPGATAIRPYRQPPDGLTDVIAVLGVRGTCDLLRRYSELCREDPTQARWWSPGMFRPRRWAEIERRASAPLPSELWTGVPGGPAKIAGPDDY